MQQTNDSENKKEKLLTNCLIAALLIFCLFLLFITATITGSIKLYLYAKGYEPAAFTQPITKTDIPDVYQVGDLQLMVTPYGTYCYHVQPYPIQKPITLTLDATMSLTLPQTLVDKVQFKTGDELSIRASDNHIVIYKNQ